MTLERSNIAAMQGYAPGEQPQDLTTIKLNTNENPYPPSPEVAAALSAFDVASLRRYPNPIADEFRRIAADLHGLSLDNVIPTNGGDELLRAALRAHRAHQPSSRRELVHERLRQGGRSGAHVYGVERPAVLRVPEPTVRRRERDDAVVQKPRLAVGAEVFF